MDSETIENFVLTMGRHDFTKVVLLLLTRVFRVNAVNVDGPNDQGSDWRVFKDAGGSTTVAYQDTVQKAYVEEKAFADAKKAVTKSGATRYFFFTTRRVSAPALKKLENKIVSDLKVPATCLGAQEIAQFIISENIISEFLDAIGAPLARGLAARPESAEVLLHAYSNFSADRFSHQDQVYDDSLLLTCKSDGPLTRDDLVARTLSLLSCPSSRRGILLKRIDVLLSKRRLRAREDKKLELDPAAATELDQQERLYLKEFSGLQSAQKALVEHLLGMDWSPQDTERTAVYIAQALVKSQLDAVQSAGALASAPGLVKNLGDPIQNLRDYLKGLKVPGKKIEGMILQLIEQAKDLPIIRKLTRSAVYVALEGADPISSAKAIGAARWSDVKIMLDTSVAIPYLCRKLYQTSLNSASVISADTVQQLLDLRGIVVIPWIYINESASHLLRALDYASLDEFSQDLQYSENAYVANYYGLKSAGVTVPTSINEYLKTFSQAVASPHADKDTWIRNVMPDIQQLFGDYEVEYENISRIPDEMRKAFEIDYTFQLKEGKINKSPILIEHDVLALSHIRRQVTQYREHWILLTWDKVMIAVGRNAGSSGWVVSPEVASDFVQPSRPLTEITLCGLSHKIARSGEKQAELSAALIDRIVTFAHAKLQDWEFRQKIKEFRDNILARVDYTKADYSNWVDRETDRFLEDSGIVLTTKTSPVTELDEPNAGQDLKTPG